MRHSMDMEESAIITEVFPGPDNLVQVVSLWTRSTVVQLIASSCQFQMNPKAIRGRMSRPKDPQHKKWMEQP